MKNLHLLNAYRRIDKELKYVGAAGSHLAGIFEIPSPIDKKRLFIICSAAMENMGEVGEWDHVSISKHDKCPNWEEMCYIKDMFFEEEDAVMQLHPPKSMWVNNHPYCLHLWRPVKQTIPLPPPIMVGIKALGEIKV